MKTTYITLLIFAILLILFLIMYFINIPSPGKIITETFVLELK